LKDKGIVSKGETLYPDTIIEGLDNDIAFIFNNKWSLHLAFMRNKIKIDGEYYFI
jgi:hypothetical protein